MPWPEVRIDWDGDGFDTAQAKAPIYDRGQPVTIAYGRDTGRAFGPLAPGRAGFEIDNRTGDYHPENAASPLHDDLHAGAPVRITVPHPGGGDVVLFRGYLDDYTLDPELTRKSVDATCTDALSRLRGSTVSTAVHKGLRTGEAIGLLLDAAGWPTELRDLDRGATVIPYWWVENADVGNELDRLLDTEGPGSLLTVNADGAVVFRDRHHRLTSTASTTVQATYTGADTEPVVSPPMKYDHGWKDIVNTVQFEVRVRAAAAEPTVVGTASGTWQIPDGSTVPLTVTASDPFIDAITPEAGVDYTVAGTVAVALARTSGQSVTVYVTASGSDATVTDMQVRAYSLAGAVVRVEAEDSTSITKHGRRSWPSGREPTYATVWDAQAIAAIILGGRAERLPTVTFTLHGAAGVDRATQQVERDLSDRVHLTAGGVDVDMFVERIEHTIGAVVRDTVFACEKVPEHPADVMIVGTGLLGTNTLGQVGLDDPDLIFLLDAGELDANLLAH